MTWIRRPNPVVIVILTLLSAALLVIYLQHRALVTLDRQTTVILEKISEQAAQRIADDVRATLEGPVFDTLTGVNHPELKTGRMDLIARHYEEGLRKYPHVERFFVWNDQTEATVPGEVVFYGPGDDLKMRRAAPMRPARIAELADLWRDPDMGSLIVRRARAHAESQQIYSALQERLDGKTYDIFVRLFYTDAAREEYFALLGFVVCLDSAPGRLFPQLYDRKLSRLLESGEGGPNLTMQVVDERGRILFGAHQPLSEVRGRATLPAVFYPATEIRTRLAAEVPAREWTILVAPASREDHATLAGAPGYWLSGLSVLLMLVALAFAVQGQKRASQLARMQAEFVSHVSHQLKTPLSLISGVTETLALERVRSPAKLAQYVDILRDEAARLSHLIERILEFSRVDSRGRQYELEVVPLTTLVRETTDLFGQKMAGAGYTISFHGVGEAYVKADPAALEQVLVNLLENAVKYSNGRRDIAVRVGRFGANALVEVEDHGVGIAPAEQGRIFERFYRAPGPTAQQPGFGLGLAIVQEIVAAHGGRVEVESVPGHGSTFRVRLPALRGTVPVRPERERRRVSGQPGQPWSGRAPADASRPGA